MRRAFVAAVVALAIAAIGHAADRPWTLIRSEHLALIGQQSSKTLQRIAVDLEAGIGGALDPDNSTSS